MRNRRLSGGEVASFVKLAAGRPRFVHKQGSNFCHFLRTVALCSKISSSDLGRGYISVPVTVRVTDSVTLVDAVVQFN